MGFPCFTAFQRASSLPVALPRWRNPNPFPLLAKNQRNRRPPGRRRPRVCPCSSASGRRRPPCLPVFQNVLPGSARASPPHHPRGASAPFDWKGNIMPSIFDSSLPSGSLPRDEGHLPLAQLHIAEVQPRILQIAIDPFFDPVRQCLLRD